jgi:hypothetical protein
MAEYKGIKGFKVQYLSADPSDPNIGQTWYNSTSKDLKYTGATAAGAWATGNNLNTARQVLGGAGTQTAALAFGGGYWSSLNTAATEEYDGTNWANGNNMKQQELVRRLWNSNSSFSFGGNLLTYQQKNMMVRIGQQVESFKHSKSTAGAGTQTAALAFGGYLPPDTGATEEYDGSYLGTSQEV